MGQVSENWVTVAQKPALAAESVIGVVVGDLDIAIYHVGGQLYATDNICPHADAYLNHGHLRGDVIECPIHGARFEIKTGNGLGGAPYGCLKTFAVRLVGEDIQVDIAGVRPER